MPPLLDGGAAAQPGGDVDGAEMTPIDGSLGIVAKTRCLGIVVVGGKRALAEKHSEVPSGDAETQKHVDGTEMTVDADVTSPSDGRSKVVEALKVLRGVVSVRKCARALGVICTRVKTTGKAHRQKKIDIFEDCRRTLAEKHSVVFRCIAVFHIH